METKRNKDRRVRPRIYRSKEDSVLAGVAGGIGEYLQIDPAFLRIIGAFLTLVTGILPGVLVYGIAALAIPKKEDRRSA